MEVQQRMTGAEFKTIRQNLGLTQEAIAERLGVHEATVRRWEKEQLPISSPVAQLVTIWDAPRPPAGTPLRVSIARHTG